MSPVHGEHLPGSGWYDSGRGAWVDKPSRLGPEPAPAWQPSDYDRERYAESQRPRFKVNANLEQLRKLRDSTVPEDRADFKGLAKGKTRMELHDYETQLAKHVDDGGELPTDVAPPKAE